MRVSEIIAPDFLAESEEEQDFLTGLAVDLIGMLESTERDMAAKFDGQLFDLDEGNALWALLPAKVRTAIKRGREKAGGVCSDCGGVGTHTRNCTIEWLHGNRQPWPILSTRNIWS